MADDNWQASLARLKSPVGASASVYAPERACVCACVCVCAPAGRARQRATANEEHRREIGLEHASERAAERTNKRTANERTNWANK